MIDLSRRSFIAGTLALIAAPRMICESPLTFNENAVSAIGANICGWFVYDDEDIERTKGCRAPDILIPIYSGINIKKGTRFFGHMTLIPAFVYSKIVYMDNTGLNLNMNTTPVDMLHLPGQETYYAMPSVLL